MPARTNRESRTAEQRPAAAPKQMEIYFVGLCLFTKGSDDEIHVFLPQPKHLPYPMPPGLVHEAGHQAAHDRTHRATLLLLVGDAWAATEIEEGTTFTFGADKQTARMPDVKELSSVSRLPEGKKLDKKEAHADTDVKSSHVVLRGGTLATVGNIGRWRVEGEVAYFPRMVQWTGSDTSGDPNGLIAFWNAMPSESPSLGYPSTIPMIEPPEDDAAARAADHFKAYYHILAGVPGPPFTFIDEIERPGGDGPFTNASRSSVIVSSCPSGGGDLYP